MATLAENDPVWLFASPLVPDIDDSQCFFPLLYTALVKFIVRITEEILAMPWQGIWCPTFDQLGELGINLAKRARLAIGERNETNTIVLLLKAWRPLVSLSDMEKVGEMEFPARFWTHDRQMQAVARLQEQSSTKKQVFEVFVDACAKTSIAPFAREDWMHL